MKFKTLFSFLQKGIAALLILILLANVYTLVMQLAFDVSLPKVFGFGKAIVISSSMEPALSGGDLLIIREQSEYQVGDIVTYQWGKSLCTHRILSFDGDQMITKGDANNVADEPTLTSYIHGKVVFRIPGFGNFILFLKTPLGIFLIAVATIVLLEAPYLIKKISLHKK